MERFGKLNIRKAIRLAVANGTIEKMAEDFQERKKRPPINHTSRDNIPMLTTGNLSTNFKLYAVENARGTRYDIIGASSYWLLS